MVLIASQLAAIEFGKFKLFEHGAGVAQFRDRRVEHLLLLGLGLRPFGKAHHGKPRLCQRRHALIDIDR